MQLCSALPILASVYHLFLSGFPFLLFVRLARFSLFLTPPELLAYILSNLLLQLVYSVPDAL